VRQVLLFGTPFVLPIALYLVWYTRASRAAQAAGHDTPKLGDVPWPWLVAIAVLLVVGVFGAFTMMSGDQSGGHYEPPHLQDGQIVPGRITR
jgi:hypothetical protein